MRDWEPFTNALPFLVAAIAFLVFVWQAAARSRQRLAQWKETLSSNAALYREAVSLTKEGIADQKKILDTLLEIKLALKGERN